MEITEWAKINNLTQEEFTKEILTIAAAVGTTRIDNQDDDNNTLVFSCEDDVGKIKVIVTREIN